MQLNVVILAAGKGRRMASATPKVMHRLAGIPLLQRVIRTAQQLNPYSIQVIYSNTFEVVRESLRYLDVAWIDQKEPKGTGHAVQQALPYFNENSRVLVLYGDVPLISVATLKKLLSDTPMEGLGILVAKMQDPTGLGRIVRDTQGNMISIVEHHDATPEQRAIQEVNTGIIVCHSARLRKWLPLLKPHNQQQEYYFTDIIKLAAEEALPINSNFADSEMEIQGINDLWQLTNLERAYQRENAKRLALSGVRIMDPERLDVRSENVKIANDVLLDINVVLEGDIVIGRHSTIGVGCVLKDVEIGEGVTIFPHSIIEGAKIADGTQVGPFARIRPGTILEKNSKVGNFVEMKKTILGPGSKANHLTYLGDALIEAEVNIGAGTITCNYDGVNKWSTVIKKGAFIGSNAALVAPVTVGENATIGAGSIVTTNAPANQLTIARARQAVVPGWERPARKSFTENNPSCGSES